MSRWRPDRLLVALEPERLSMVRVRTGEKREVRCDDPVAALADAMKPLAGERLRVSVVLSNRLVRYAVIPRDAAVSAPEEERALARFHFTRIYGEAARSWDIRLSEATRLASAVDAGLVPSIERCFPKGGRTKLVSVQPYLAAVFNRRRAEIGRKGGWLAVLEPGRICVGLAAADGWRAVQTSRVESTWMEALERERLRVAPESAQQALVWDDAPFAMALSAQ